MTGISDKMPIKNQHAYYLAFFVLFALDFFAFDFFALTTFFVLLTFFGWATFFAFTFFGFALALTGLTLLKLAIILRLSSHHEEVADLANLVTIRSSPSL